MIDFFFGKPRSGKTYRAVKVIYDLYLSTDEVPKYRNILTNIGGFKFDLVNQKFIDKGSASKAYNLNWKSFYNHLTKMYEMALDDKSDDDLNRYASYHFINDCYIIIDEASLYMKKYDDVISWYLAYHGHFSVRIIIIAQSPKQINAEYMSHTEIFYDAQPQSKQFSDNKLRYIHYSDIPFNKDNKFSSNTITTSPELYDLYKSGEIDKPKKIIYKYIALVVAALLVMIFFINLLLSNMKNRVKVDEDISIDNNVTLSINQSYINQNGKQLINFRCDSSSCWNNDPVFKQNTISLSYLKFIVIKYKLDLEYSEVVNQIYQLHLEQRGSSKVTFSYLTDYYYFVPDDIKEQYLSKLFVLKIPEKRNNNFLTDDELNPSPLNNGVARERHGAP